MIQNNEALLARLRQNGVQFVVIGGVCSVYYGVPIATFDLDICCRFDEPNLRRIEAAMRDLHPIHRLAANKLPLELTSELCLRLKNLYLQTDLGILDCLSEVAGVGGYEEVLRQSVTGELLSGKSQFLSMDALIAAKQAVGRGRDLETLKHLRAIKEKLSHKPPLPKPKD
jgi:hypothetical protein